jgi:citrate lyase beta subunit
VSDAIAYARSLLFAPASDETKLTKAFASGADAVIADLEDAVAPDAKERAREIVTRVLGARAIDVKKPCARIVRINSVDSPYWREDLDSLGEIALDAIMLPKATPEAVDVLGATGPPVIALIETAVGLRRAFETADRPRVAALALGAADLGVELRLEPRPDGLELLYARSQIVVDSAAACIRGPVDVVHMKTRDAAGLEKESHLARSLGFAAKLCIHPAQVEVVNRVFAPSDAQVAWAQAAIEAHEEGLRAGRGAVSLDGELIDAPVVERARAIIEAARRETP